jgi:8-oxo-dGTP pyrophosphatase MutT (NUDIX family)
MSPWVDRNGLRLALAGTVPPPKSGASRQAGVAVVLDDDGCVLLIRRAERAGDPWSGQIALPGGRWDPGDEDTRATAIRETREETGIDLARAELLGALREVRTVRGLPDLGVTPWVFGVASFAEAGVSDEVTEVLPTPLAALNGAARGSFSFEWEGQAHTLPCVDLGPHRLWGMTLRMLDDLLSRVAHAR